jgi:alpha-glucosidase (family GH31 glycosyl hydrolase)
MDGRGGEHREARNLYALLMNRAGYEGQRSLMRDAAGFRSGGFRERYAEMGRRYRNGGPVCATVPRL